MPFFIKNPQTSGNGLALELGLAVVGLALGLTASIGFMRVEQDGNTGRFFSRAGKLYAGFSIVIIAARLLFTYGASHWYTQSLGTWLATNHMTSDALTDALIFLAIVMALSRTARFAVPLISGTEGKPLSAVN
mgnify:CR=1 FL=1